MNRGSIRCAAELSTSFLFSDNKPYRIDLFGDEVDSIRHFDLSSQLSVDRLQQIEVVPNLKDAVSGRERVSFPAFAAGATYWLDDGEYTLKRFQDIRTKLLGELDDPAQIDTLVTGRKGFLADTAGATMVLLKDNARSAPPDATISFHTSPQPQFNKKFELLADDIRDNREKGYTTCLLTENKAQIERLRNIFNSMGERDVRSRRSALRCTPVLSTTPRGIVSIPTTSFSTGTTATRFAAGSTAAKASRSRNLMS